VLRGQRNGSPRPLIRFSWPDGIVKDFKNLPSVAWLQNPLFTVFLHFRLLFILYIYTEYLRSVVTVHFMCMVFPSLQPYYCYYGYNVSDVFQVYSLYSCAVYTVKSFVCYRITDCAHILYLVGLGLEIVSVSETFTSNIENIARNIPHVLTDRWLLSKLKLIIHVYATVTDQCIFFIFFFLSFFLYPSSFFLSSVFYFYSFYIF
jgi:hypothetical protein